MELYAGKYELDLNLSFIFESRNSIENLIVKMFFLQEKRKSRDMETITEFHFMGAHFSTLVHQHLITEKCGTESDSENSLQR